MSYFSHLQVLYFLDSVNNTVGLVKKKTTWYVVLRAIREKVSSAVNAYRKNPGGFSSQVASTHHDRIKKRLAAIKIWLDLTDEEVKQWTRWGINFQNWVIAKIR